MTDSTNPRVMADNIRELSSNQGSQAAELEALGSYSATEVNTGMKYGDDNIYRKIFIVETLPNTTSDLISHGITNLGNVLNLYGVIQSSGNRPGRNMLSTGSNISYFAYDSTSITYTTNADLSALGAIIVMQYTKSAAPTPDVLPSPDPDTRALKEPEPEPEPIEEKK